MENNTIELKPVKDLLGMNFFIPDYQRGYRWEKQQAIDLLEDIYSFAEKAYKTEEIYCIQPLVVSSNETDEEILKKCKAHATNLEDIKRFIKGSWTVVDGQQRLTTIYLLLTCLDIENTYEIDYCTRGDSKTFLKGIKEKKQDEANKNIDYYHMYMVYTTICEWLKLKDDDHKDKIKNTLLNQVTFIWYQIDKTEEINVFTRLNIGKIPLTDAELIKALFLNKTNFDSLDNTDSKLLEIKQIQIAQEWDQIEQTLQNDEFWAFICNFEYNKPTRIDFILDSICKKNIEGNEDIKKKIGNDEHKTFRYFNEIFNTIKAKTINTEEETYKTDWLKNLWGEVRKFYQVLIEWYQDYRLYHYIGYLSISSKKFDVVKYETKWEEETKSKYVDWLKGEIVALLNSKSWLNNIENYSFDQEGGSSKRECVDILLLHNIETIIQQNDKIVSDTKYNLPNFTKFPFHLYKKEKWQVEHIRPNAGDNTENIVLYLTLAKTYLNRELQEKIDLYISENKDKKSFDNNKDAKLDDLLFEVYQYGEPLSEADKNKIWNFVLLDETTNEEYGNQIFPVKRMFIANKINGKKIKYSYENGRLIPSEPIPEVAFVPPCTKNVFSKFYTPTPKTMINWNNEDAEAYWNDMSEKLKYYFDKNRD